MKRVRIATRASELALAQARGVAARVEAELGAATELVPLKTSGDRLPDVSLAKLGGKGLFVKELEEALLDGRADLAVHSAKDLPAATPAGLVLAAFPLRADPRDALVARERGAGLAGLRRGARVGTGSLRRGAPLRAHRPDLEIVPLRGNVGTRLRRLDEAGLDALVLACAGLERLGLAERIDERIDPDWMLPAVGQGALALETRAGDPLAAELAVLSDPATAACVAAERGFLARLGGDCTLPLAALAEGGAQSPLRLRALLAAADGSRMLRARREGGGLGAAALGAAAAEDVLSGGGEALLAELRARARA
jgi:hydroxymethylbilane synthase